MVFGVGLEHRNKLYNVWTMEMVGEKKVVIGVQQMINQGPNWTEIISCVAAVGAVVAPLLVWWFKHSKTKK